jgi:hypothetical protein
MCIVFTGTAGRPAVSLDFDDLISEFTTRNAQREPLWSSVTPRAHTCQNENKLNLHLSPHFDKESFKTDSFLLYLGRTHSNSDYRSTNAITVIQEKVSMSMLEQW